MSRRRWVDVTKILLKSEVQVCLNKIGFIRTSSCDYDDWKEIEGYGLNCHCWICPECAKYLKNKLLDRITLGLESVNTFYFMTLTSSYRDMEIKRAWNRFNTRINYKFPVYRYVWVMELTPPSHEYEDFKGDKRRTVGGLRHLHVLIAFNEDTPTKEQISDIWRTSTQGKAWQVHFEELSNLRSPAGYMSKYLTKSLDAGFLYNEKRIGFSKNFPKSKNNLEPKPGVFMAYDPRHEPIQNDEFTKMLADLNQPYLEGKRYL